VVVSVVDLARRKKEAGWTPVDLHDNTVQIGSWDHHPE
jgi:hypothetical protein